MRPGNQDRAVCTQFFGVLFPPAGLTRVWPSRWGFLMLEVGEVGDTRLWSCCQLPGLTKVLSCIQHRDCRVCRVKLSTVWVAGALAALSPGSFNGSVLRSSLKSETDAPWRSLLIPKGPRHCGLFFDGVVEGEGCPAPSQVL